MDWGGSSGVGFRKALVLVSRWGGVWTVVMGGVMGVWSLVCLRAYVYRD